MKNILCFGDSNTWGYIPASNCERYPADVRWAGVLQANLGDGFRVIEAPQPAPTTVFDDPYESVCKNGSRHLPIALESHKPLDLVIVMLGTNDLKQHLNQNAQTIAAGAGVLVDRVTGSDAGPTQAAPRILLISPALIHPSQCPFGHKFDGAHAKSLGFAAAYREVADTLDVPFLDAAEFVTVPETDCIHFDETGHAAMGAAAADKVRLILV
jgi:lysophospholipase L1-like esterase